jgi:DNA-binding transcriptional MerR regulator
METTTYTIGELARRCGLTVRTVRFYADAGLLRPGRTESGYRLFDDRDVLALDLIRVLREAGASLEAIRAVLVGAADLGEVLDMRLAAMDAVMWMLAEPLDGTASRSIPRHPRISAGQTRAPQGWRRKLAGRSRRNGEN